jgi:lysozyme
MSPQIRINPKVVDLYHDDNLGTDTPEHNFAKAFKAGIRGIIHKATEGGEMVDRMCRTREIAARATGMLWGWYHFMRPGDPARQAEHFVVTIGAGMAGPGILVLDHEDDKVSVANALRWMQLVHMMTGRTPWLYSGFLIREQMDGRHAPIWADFPLWLPEFGDVANVPQPWQKATLWQFTGDGEGPLPHTISGIALKHADISSFDGTDEELREAWK